MAGYSVSFEDSQEKVAGSLDVGDERKHQDDV